MSRTWQTNEVIRCLADADQDELQELIKSSGEDATEAMQEWVREGNAPKSLYDAVMRFTTDPNHSFDAVDWEKVIEQILHDT